MASGRVFLHVGLPKTGTTHIQETLWHNRAAATAQGLLYPGYVASAHFHAAIDLQRSRYDAWVTPLADGAWDRLVEYVRRWPGDAVISSELLATATHEQIDRALASLAFAEVHVVCTARDLARQVPSVWQENVRNRHTESFHEFLSAIRRPAPSPVGDLFWSYQNLSGVLANWSRDIPAEWVHVVTVPARNAPTGTLWRRFASVTGLDPNAFDDPSHRDNHSLGFSQTELLRRVNLAMDAAVGWPQYLTVVKEYLSAKVLSAQKSRTDIVLPPSESTWVHDRAERFARQIKAAGYDVVGDLTELVPDETPGPELEPTESELLATAVAALANLAGRLPPNPDQDRTAERVKHALRTFTEQHPPAMALRQLYWKGKAKVSWTRGR
jgi:hypothetical protein